MARKDIEFDSVWNSFSKELSKFDVKEMEILQSTGDSFKVPTFTSDVENSYGDLCKGKLICQTEHSRTEDTSYGKETAQDIPEIDIEAEPPLLEELGIDLDMIIGKAITFLFFPVGDECMYDTDLTGPVGFCIAIGISMFLSAGISHFSYIYGVVLLSCIVMYVVLNLLSPEKHITFGSVATVLGYCLFPIVALSLCGILFSLRNEVGLIMCVLIIMWSSLAASKIFVQILFISAQMPLVVFPCILFYGLFALIIVF